MAIVVPRLEQSVPEQALPTVRVDPSAPLSSFGGGAALERTAQAGQQTIDGARDFFLEEKKKADDLFVQELRSSGQREGNRLRWDPVEGAFNHKGKDALGIMKDYGTRYSKYLDQLSESSTSDEQKVAFRRIRLDLQGDFEDSLQKHTFAEVSKFDDESTKYASVLEREDAVLNFEKPGRIERAIENQKAMIRAHGQRTGKPPEVIALETYSAISATHEAVINHLTAQGRDLDAEQYFERVKDQLSSIDRDQAEAKVREGSLLGKAQRASEQIWRESGGNFDTAMERARKEITDPKMFEEVKRLIRQRREDNQDSDRTRYDKLMLDSSNHVESNKQRPDPATWALLKLSDKNALDNRIEQLRKGIEPEPNSESYYNLKTQASQPNLKGKFLTTNLLTYRGRVTNQELKELIGIQTTLRNGDTPAELDDYRTKKQIEDSGLSANGIDPTPKTGGKDAKLVNQFHAMVAERVRAEQEQAGKKINNERYQQIVDDLLVEGTVQGSGVFGFFQKSRRKFEIEPGENIELEPNQIPKSERRKIEDALRRKNKPVTDGAVLELYLQRVGQEVTRGN